MANEILPKTMRAVLFDRSAKRLELVNSQPVPQPNFEEMEHLLKVHSIAVTNGELVWPFPDMGKDYSPGVEMSGTVILSPPGSRFPIGSHVYMRTTYPRSGSAREYVIALDNELAFQPRNLTPEETASIPVSALTAWQALFVQAGYRANLVESEVELSSDDRKRILIIGASGSVGIWLTQLAHACGFWVTGTCHTRNIEFARSLGADEIIDYTATSVRQWVENNQKRDQFDLVIDCVGGPHAADAWYAVRADGGLFLSIVGPDDGNLKWVLDRPADVNANVKGRFFIMESNGEQLQQITDLVEKGKLKPVLDSIYELEDYRKAFDRVDSGKARGKVIIRISGI